jgi:periodic tryptophan protein 1
MYYFSQARVFDCRSEKSVKSWSTHGEVEKVMWNHFSPFTFLSATETGYVQLFDVRQESKAVWTLSAHSEGINGLVLSPQCPDCLVTVSSDETMKVWDLTDAVPKCVQERDMKLGRLHCAEGCPDAPFVVCMGGDKSGDNMRVLDIRESADGETEKRPKQ